MQRDQSVRLDYLHQPGQQGDRIGAAGDQDDPGVAGLDQSGLPNRTDDQVTDLLPEPLKPPIRAIAGHG